MPVNVTQLVPNSLNLDIVNDSNNTLVINSQIRLDTNNLNIEGSTGETDLKGQIVGYGVPPAGLNDLIVSTSGTVVLSASNSYFGTTQILSGTLVVSNAQALGLANDDAASGTILSSGASLEIDGPLTISNELLTVINSSNPNYSYSYAYLSGVNSSSSGITDWTGNINVNNYEFELESYTGAFKVDGNITSTSSDVYTYGKVIFTGADSLYYLGNTGSLEVDGTVSTSYYFYNSGTLSGTGTIDTTTGNPLYLVGTLVPGNASGLGILQANNVYFDPSRHLQRTNQQFGLWRIGVVQQHCVACGQFDCNAAEQLHAHAGHNVHDFRQHGQ